jgi:hypothetical protein
LEHGAPLTASQSAEATTDNSTVRYDRRCLAARTNVFVLAGGRI